MSSALGLFYFSHARGHLLAADENLGPSCDNDHNDLCSEEQRAILGKYNKMTESERKAIISKADAAVASAEAKFNKEVEKLQAKAEAIEAEKTAQVRSSRSLHRCIFTCGEPWAVHDCECTESARV